MRALEIRIFVAYPKRFLHVWRSAGTSSHFRRVYQVILANMALGRHITFALSLRIPSGSCIYGAWRAHKISISAALVGFLTERKEGSARVPRDPPSQFVHRICFPNSVELQSSIKAVLHTPSFRIQPNSRSPRHGAATRIHIVKA